MVGAGLGRPAGWAAWGAAQGLGWAARVVARRGTPAGRRGRLILTIEPALKVICPSVTTVSPGSRPAVMTAVVPSVGPTLIGCTEHRLVGPDHKAKGPLGPTFTAAAES